MKNLLIKMALECHYLKCESKAVIYYNHYLMCKLVNIQEMDYVVKLIRNLFTSINLINEGWVDGDECLKRYMEILHKILKLGIGLVRVLCDVIILALSRLDMDEPYWWLVGLAPFLEKKHFTICELLLPKHAHSCNNKLCKHKVQEFTKFTSALLQIVPEMGYHLLTDRRGKLSLTDDDIRNKVYLNNHFVFITLFTGRDDNSFYTDLKSNFLANEAFQILVSLKCLFMQNLPMEIILEIVQYRCSKQYSHFITKIYEKNKHFIK